MPAPELMLDLYLHLAAASEEQVRPLQRDKFLVLAATIAEQSGFSRIAEDCRNRVLEHNPHHLLGNYASMREAVRAEDVGQINHQLTRIYPFEKAEYLLHKFRAGGYSGDHGFGELDGAYDVRLLPPPTPASPRRQRSSRPVGHRSKPDNQLESEDAPSRPLTENPFADRHDDKVISERAPAASFTVRSWWSVVTFLAGVLLGAGVVASLLSGS